MKTKDITLVSLFTALTAIGAFFTVPIGQIPITLQSLFVILSGLLLGPKLGALSQLVYVVLGLIGLPIFAGYKGGFQTILGPTFGFLIGYIVASYVVGKITYKDNRISRARIWISAAVGSLVIYVFGLPYMYMILNLYMGGDYTFFEIMNMGFIVFIPGDIIKYILSSILAVKIIPILRKNLVEGV